jgi:site-specific DNA recombinase
VWSGTDRHRPALDALLDRLLPGDVVLAYDLDRLSRGGQIDTAVIIDRIESAGGSVAFVTLDFEQSETGALLRNVRAFAAALEREKIAERTQRGRRARAMSGKPLPGAKAHYGYTWIDSEKTRLDLDPEHAPVVRRVFDLALSGRPLRQIAATLENSGIPSPSGSAKWAACSVRHILTRPVYAGSHVAYREHLTRKAGGGYARTWSDPGRVVIIADIAPPIVTTDEMTAVAAKMQHNQAQSVRRNRQPDLALLRGGLVVCGHCGWSLTVQNPPPHNPTRSAVYRCRSRTMHVHDCPQPGIAASLLDGPVWERVASILRDPGIIAAEVNKVRDDGGLDHDLTAIERHIAGLTTKQGRIAKRLTDVDDDDVAALMLAELKALSAQKAAAEAERDSLQQRLVHRDTERARVRSLAEWCRTVSSNLNSLTVGEKRLALEALGVTVQVWRGDAVSDDGGKLPRWELTLQPTPPEDVTAFHTSRCSPAAPSATSAARRR